MAAADLRRQPPVSDKRLGALLRGLRGAALPGHTVVVYDPDSARLYDMVGILTSIGASSQTFAFVLLAQMGSIGFLLAVVPGIIGGRPLPTWLMMILGMYGCILINISLFVPTLSDPATVAWGPISLANVLLTAWALLACALLWLGRRGWQGLMQRPHPFLPH